MLFEELDNKIKEAANLHHPSYHADAWERMECILDKHLPVKEKKKRRFIFWWFIPVLVGGALLTYRSFFANNSELQNKKADVKNLTQSQGYEKNKPTLVDKNNLYSNNKNQLISKAVVEKKLQTNSTPASTFNKKKYTLDSKNLQSWGNKKTDILISNTQKKGVLQNGLKLDNKNEEENNIINFQTNNKNKNSPNSQVSPLISFPVSKENKPLVFINPPKDSAKTEIQNSITEALLIKDSSITKIKGKKKNQLALFVSAGPDVSYVNGNGMGTTKIIAGGGIAYTIKNKLTLRTGFFSGKKIYSADGASYKGNSTFYQYYPYLENVSANCKVYEIPLSISYNFTNKKLNNLFASAGISTLIMKTENYHYYYKYSPTGSLYERPWTYNNENKHLFSILTLSAGYQHLLGKKTFLMIEPYFKLPLNGVGAGKIKLNSTGILFTAGIKLF